MAEDVWQNLPFDHVTDGGSVTKFVFELKWPVVNEKWLAFPTEQVDFWRIILEVLRIRT